MSNTDYVRGYDSDSDAEDPFSGMWMEGDSLAPPCGCEPELIPHIMSTLGLKDDDTFYDLGAGDGRVCLAASPLCKAAVGVEIDPGVCERFRSNIEQSNAKNVSCIEGDLRDVNLGPATALHVYLLQEGLDAIKESVATWLGLGEGRRVLCNTWGWKEWDAEVITVDECNGTRLLVFTAASMEGNGDNGGTTETT